MGRKNAVTKRFCSDTTRFADLVNGVYFQGRDVIHPESLTEVSEVYAEPVVSEVDENREYLERVRDIKMRHQSGTSIRILAIENQHYVDYSMPFRNMQYDVLEYQHQLEEIKHRNEIENSYSSANESVRRHIVVGANCILFSAEIPIRLCRTGMHRRLLPE